MRDDSTTTTTHVLNMIPFGFCYCFVLILPFFPPESELHCAPGFQDRPKCTFRIRKALFTTPHPSSKASQPSRPIIPIYNITHQDIKRDKQDSPTYIANSRCGEDLKYRTTKRESGVGKSGSLGNRIAFILYGIDQTRLLDIRNKSKSIF